MTCRCVSLTCILCLYKVLSGQAKKKEFFSETVGKKQCAIGLFFF